MPLWKKLWLLFAVIWVVVAGLNAGTILAFAEEEGERAKALVPLAFAFAVPAAAYLLLWGWFRFRRK
jgi:hypothetical protein